MIETFKRISIFIGLFWTWVSFYGVLAEIHNILFAKQDLELWASNKLVTQNVSLITTIIIILNDKCPKDAIQRFILDCQAWLRWDCGKSIRGFTLETVQTCIVVFQVTEHACIYSQIATMALPHRFVWIPAEVAITSHVSGPLFSGLYSIKPYYVVNLFHWHH